YHALLPPHRAGRQQAVLRQAGELRARAGAARRPVVGVAGAEHEAARVGDGAGAEQLDVIDLVALARDAGLRQRALDAPRPLGERRDVARLHVEAVVVAEEEPVAAVGEVARDSARAAARRLERHAHAAPQAVRADVR